ncbi:CubicO group peptidase (beta-lactamase class C family) [Anseongella ginsenosidimutans]|uniref:CubicO group peptidase (Beta-lactamase class C family) n=1 Tax=Anseongella ginsenosidimutans TaxID=496056 RepID=A0A4R3KLR4_9SPHI|nr:serine hydrolase domain-containing protein [Anseongella ginsenosidimutans]TCS85081.1 CubicO group peptidase (beta-lactamase class C family) [Anseongella ginsenosidimutans]
MVAKHILSGACLAFMVSCLGWAPSTAQSKKQLAAEIAAIMADYQAVGAAVAVVKDNKVVYSKSFGWKDTAARERLEPGDIFRIASISKSFTATGIMQLVEAGKLSLDDDVGELIGFPVRNPNFPDSVITLEMVLSHRSSISDENGYFTLDVFNPDKDPNWAKAYNDYAPGADYQYCNLNFNLAGAILEKYSGERLDHYVRRHILQPLSLYGGYNVDDLDSTRFVTLYAYNGNTKGFTASPAAYRSRAEALEDYQMGYSTPVFSPTGGMKMSAEDLARYMIMHMNYGEANGVRILSQASSRSMQRVRSPESGYGMALRTLDYLIPGKKLVGHEGIAYGLYSAMYFQPEEHFGIVVITNGCRTGFSHGDVINDFLFAMYDSVYRNLFR